MCTIKFDENGKATVSIKGKENGKFEGLKCEGTKDNMVCGDIPVVNCSFTPSEDNTIKSKVYTVKDYDACMTYLKSTIPEEELTDEILNQADSVCKGNGIPEHGESTSEFFEQEISNGYISEQELIDLNVINVEEIDVYEYVNGQYTYRYGQKYVEDNWYTIGNDGWGVTLTDKESTDPVVSDVCTYINGKPIVSMSGMFYQSKAETIDFSNFNTSNVTTMQDMFRDSSINTLDLSNFDTSKVTNMFLMFYECDATTTGYARTQTDADKFNTSSSKPSALTFVVKES